MRALAQSEQRTMRFALIAVSIYLVLFFGFRSWRFLETKSADYRGLLQEAKALSLRVQPYHEKTEVVRTLMETFRMDPAKISRSSVVGDASAAIQKAAASGGMQFGPIRESSARASNKELASMQLEGSGSVPAIMGFLHSVTTLGYPIVLDAVQISSDPTKPGAIKVSLTIVILDFEQWKKVEAPHA